MLASVLPSVIIVGEANNPYYCLLYLEKNRRAIAQRFCYATMIT